MPAPTLRPYQQAAIQAVIQARRDGLRRMVVCLPTGAGKTVVFAELARLARRPVLVLAHRRELVDQARDKLARALGDPQVVGVEQGDSVADQGARVVVASIRSLHEPRLAQLLARQRFGLIVYDECHHAPAADNQRVLRSLGAFDPDWDGTLLGFTATTQRGDGQALRPVFERIVYQRGMRQMIDEGYLVPLRGYRIATAADLSRVQATRGDLDLDELALAVDIESRNALVARSIQELARDRRTIAFCVTVNHARNLARALNAVGIPTGIVHGQMETAQRQQTLDLFAKGALRAITNVGVLTEGFDDPGVSCVAMARPTRSSGLYAQCVGRGTRLAPGKSDCLVLDFVDLSDLSLSSLPGLGGLPPDLDLEGQDLAQAQDRYRQLLDDNPGLEIEPGRITLDEIQRRAASFDPLSLATHPDVRAISPLAWHSLGSRGLVLHLAWRKAALSELLVLDRGGRGRRWQVLLDGKEMARFSRLEEAVEAADHEIQGRGPAAWDSALPQAGWRRGPIPPALQAQLSDRRLPEAPTNHGEALRLWAWQTHGPGARGAARR